MFTLNVRALNMRSNFLNQNCIFSKKDVPQLEEDLYFSLIGRKKLFTAGRVGSLLPPGKHAQNTGSAVKKGET